MTEKIKFFGSNQYYKSQLRAYKAAYKYDPVPARLILARMHISPDVAERFGIGWDAENPALVIQYPGTDYWIEYEAADDPFIYVRERYLSPGEGVRPLFKIDEAEDESEPWIWTESVHDALAAYQAGARRIIAETWTKDKLAAALKDSDIDRFTIICRGGETGQRHIDSIKKAADEAGVHTDVRYLKDIPLHDVLYKDPGWLGAEHKADAPTERPADRFGSARGYIGSEAQKTDTAHYSVYKNVSTGFDGLDREVRLAPGLIILNGAPSAGKTTFCEQLMLNLFTAGETVMLFAGEQTKKLVIDKVTTMRYCEGVAKYKLPGHLTNSDILYGATDDLLERVKADLADEMRSDRFLVPPVDFTTSLEDIAGTVEAFITETGKKPVVMVDYLQLFTATQTDQISAIMNGVYSLKKLAHEHDLMIFLISAVARQYYSERLGMAAAKESGYIDFSADYCFGLELACVEADAYDKLSSTVRARLLHKEKTRKIRRVALKCSKQKGFTSEFLLYLDYDVAHDYYSEAGPDMAHEIDKDIAALVKEERDAKEAAKAEAEKEKQKAEAAKKKTDYERI